VVVGVLLLAGLFALLAADVGQRQREIAVRRTFGAGATDLSSWLLRRLGGVLLPGLAVGLLLSWLLAPLLARFLYGLSPRDPLLLAAAAVSISLLALVAAAISLRRTLAVTPMRALRG
jgi:ABC-type antimicrobial peptide transport system permease subunit